MSSGSGGGRAGGSATERDGGAAHGSPAISREMVVTDKSHIEHLERANRQLDSVRAIAQAGAETDLNKVLSEVTRIACEASGSEMAMLFVASEDEPAALSVAATHHLPEAILEAIPTIERAVVVSAAARTLSVQSLRAEDHPEPAIAKSGLRHIAAAPLEIRGRLVGAIDLGRRIDTPFDADDLETIRVLADQIAIVVERARLYAQSQRRVRQLTVLFDLARLGTEASEVLPLVDRVLQLAQTAIELDGAMIHLLRGDTLVLTGLRSKLGLTPDLYARLERTPIDDSSVSGRAAMTRTTVVVSGDPWPERSRMARDAGRVLAAAAIPLLFKDQLVGTICVVRSKSETFDRDEIRLLESCAAHIATAIVHARVFEAERKRAQELALINELGRLIVEQLDLEAVLEAGVRQLALIASAPHAFLMLFSPGKRGLRLAASNLQEPVDVVVSDDEPSIAMNAVRERRHVILNDLESAGPDAIYHRGHASRFQHKAMLAIPLLVRGESIGAVVIGHTERGRAFDASDVDRAVPLANQLAIAISNATLFEDLRASYRELERAQERLVQRERLAAIGEMAASIAHEVRNPLGVIFNSLASLRRFMPPGPDAEILLGIAGEEAERLNRIVGDLLDFARPSEPRVQAQSIDAIVHGAAEAATAAAGMPSERIEMNLEPSMPRLMLDAQLFRQALINLLVNALQASTSDAPVRVDARIERADARSFVRIDVSDHGPGIPPRIATQVFEPFFTTKATGTGLGLAIVKRIVEAHQGQISFRSAEGQGTTFTVMFPLDTAGL